MDAKVLASALESTFGVTCWIEGRFVIAAYQGREYVLDPATVTRSESALKAACRGMAASLGLPTWSEYRRRPWSTSDG